MPKLAQGERLNRKLEAVLARLCQQLGALTTTRAVKLPYLVDVVAAQTLGAPITGGTHETWDHGVVTREVWSYIQHGGHIHDPFEISKHSFSAEGGKQIALAGEPDDDLNAEELAIVDWVAQSYGNLDAASLGRLTKSLNTHLDVNAWGKNRPAAMNDAAYARLSDGYQNFLARLPQLDFANRQDWGEPIDDPYDYVRRKLGG